MGFFDRLETGWALATDGLAVLRRDPELAAFPLVAGVAGVVYLALLYGVAAVGARGTLASYAVLFCAYVGSTFLASFFTAGLMHETRAAFEGRDPDFRAGVRAAWANAGTLFAWALVSATVGVLLRVVQERSGLLGDLLAGLFSVAWGVLTYFVVPVVVFEDVTVREAIRRSGETFRDTWGETAGAGFGVGLVTAGFLLVGALVAVLLVVVGAATGSFLGVAGAVALAAAVLLCAYLAGVTLSGVARTALYVYATEGRAPSDFDDVDFSRTRQ